MAGIDLHYVRHRRLPAQLHLTVIRVRAELALTKQCRREGAVEPGEAHDDGALFSAESRPVALILLIVASRRNQRQTRFACLLETTLDANYTSVEASTYHWPAPIIDTGKN